MKFRRILNKSAFESVFKNKFSKQAFDCCMMNIGSLDNLFILAVMQDNGTVDSAMVFLRSGEDGVNAIEYWYKDNIQQLVEIIHLSTKWFKGNGIKQLFYTVDSMDDAVNGLMNSFGYPIKTKVYEHTEADVDLEKFERPSSENTGEVSDGSDSSSGEEEMDETSSGDGEELDKDLEPSDITSDGTAGPEA